MKKKSTNTLKITIGIALLAGVAYALSLFIDDRNKETPIVSTLMPELDDSYAQGESLYQSNCATCHGTSLGGRKGLAPPFIHGYYKPGHHSDIAFYRAMEQGVTAHHWKFGDMPAVPDLSKNEATEIIQFIRVIQRANNIQ